MEEEFLINEIEEFAQNRVWKAIVKYAIDQTNAKMEENNQIDPFKDPTTICRNQGYVQALVSIIDLPAAFKSETLWAREKERKEEKKDG